MTKLRYDGQLPSSIDGHHHNTVICQFQEWKGYNYIPNYLHPAIQWSKSQPFKLQESDDALWHIPKNSGSNGMISGTKKNDSAYTAAKGSIPIYHINEKVNSCKKRKSEEQHKSISKKYKNQTSCAEVFQQDQSNMVHVPSSAVDMIDHSKGLIWDSTNYSCAYDAFFSVLYQLWHQDPNRWAGDFSNISSSMKDLAIGFQLVASNESTFGDVRNKVQQTLHGKFGDMFPYGSRGTSVVDLAVKVFHNTNINAFTQLECVNCQFTDEPVEDELSSVTFNASEGITLTRDQLRQTLVCESDASCPECLMPLKKVTSYYNSKLSV